MYSGRVIVLQELSRSYGPLSAVDGISLDVARGECVFLVGGSGCGKTTTLKMINRLVEPSGGRVLVNGTIVYENGRVTDARPGLVIRRNDR